MVAEHYAQAIRRIEDSMVRRELSNLTDRELLARYIANRCEDSFAQIVRRYGQLVYSVCHRTIRHHQDAEDAFQAVFLVLSRKPSSIRDHQKIGAWLYGVATRIAIKSRERLIRRNVREQTGDDLSDAVSCEPAEPKDWLALFDSAMSRLNDRDRLPILFCDIQGQSRQQAAKTLGIPEGTLSSRLARAREKLKETLIQMGVAPGIAITAVFLVSELSGSIPETLILRTIQSMTARSSIAVETLYREVVRTMLVLKVSKLAGYIASAALICGVSIFIANDKGFAQNDAQKSLSVEKSNSSDQVAQAHEKAAKQALSSGTSDPKAATDLEKLYGTWIVEFVRVSGSRSDAKKDYEKWINQPMSFEKNGDFIFDAGLKTTSKTFKISPNTTPSQIDFHFEAQLSASKSEGSEQVNIPVLSKIPYINRLFKNAPNPISNIMQADLPSVYKFEGDQLHLMLGMADSPRPKSFQWSANDPEYVLLILRRPNPLELQTQRQQAIDALSGTWLGKSVKVNGKSRSIAIGEDIKLQIGFQGFQNTLGNLVFFDGETLHNAKIKLNTSVRPHTMVLMGMSLKTDPEKQDNTIKSKLESRTHDDEFTVAGIYKIEGNSMTLSLSKPGKPFPSDFVSNADYTVWEFERVPAPQFSGRGQRGTPRTGPREIPASSVSNLRTLQQKLIHELERSYDLNMELFKLGKESTSNVIQTSEELMKARLEHEESNPKKVEIVQQYIESLNSLLKIIDLRIANGKAVLQERNIITKNLILAEIQMEKLKSERRTNSNRE